jgi:uncharacterized protein (TIGR03067 family)
MTRRFWLTIALTWAGAALLGPASRAAGAGAAAEAKKDLKAMQGRWKVKSIEVQGVPVMRPFKDVVIKGDKIDWNGREATLALDASKSPRRITLTFPAKGDPKRKPEALKGSYELKGDTLVLRLADSAGRASVHKMERRKRNKPEKEACWRASPAPSEGTPAVAERPPKGPCHRRPALLSRAAVSGAKP